MSINDIRLTTFQLTALYPQSLVETEKVSPAIPQATQLLAAELPASTPVMTEETVSTEPPLLKHLGNNQKNILILINDPTQAFLSDADFDLLSNILAACKLTLADVAIVNKAHTASYYTLKDLLARFGTRTVLLLGPSATEAGAGKDIPEFELTSIGFQTYLYAPPLSAYTEKALKGKLWSCLKQLFLAS